MAETSNTDQKNIATHPDTEKTSLVEQLRQCSSLQISIMDNFDPLIEALNDRLKTQLTPRSAGYHITVINPSESETIRSMSADRLAELQAITDELSKDGAVHVRGIGFIDGAVGEDILAADKGKKTSYIALDIPKIAAFRESVGLSPADLHVTLGLVGDDIFDHYDSGVSADNHIAAIPKKSVAAFDAMSPTQVHVGPLYGVISRQPHKTVQFS